MHVFHVAGSYSEYYNAFILLFKSIKHSVPLFVEGLAVAAAILNRFRGETLNSGIWIPHDVKSCGRFNIY